MDGEVKRRAYASPGRRAQAEATRTRILETAGELFLARGYHATTTAAIGKAAGVSEASVFSTFGSKADLLIAVVSDRVGRDGDFPLRGRPVWRDVAADRAAAIAEFARVTCGAHERSWQLLGVVAAASADPVVATAAQAAGLRRHADCAWFVNEVIGLQDGDAASAADAVWALISVENYRRLVVERGWTAQTYERWLQATLSAVLLPDTSEPDQ
jgi:AcrR family transcriptional regulator